MAASEDKRKDLDTRRRVEKIHRGYERVSGMLLLAQAVQGVAVVVALVLGLHAIHDNNARIDDINKARSESVQRFCIGDRDKNGVIRRFILFSVRGDQQNRLYLEAKRVFPVKSVQQCIEEAHGPFNTGP